MEQYYLGFDAGTQSVKTAVYDIDMNLIVQDTNATILNYPHPGWVEMDADQYLHATVTGIRNCVIKMKEKNLDPDNIRSIFGDGGKRDWKSSAKLYVSSDVCTLDDEQL